MKRGNQVFAWSSVCGNEVRNFINCMRGTTPERCNRKRVSAGSNELWQSKRINVAQLVNAKCTLLILYTTANAEVAWATGKPTNVPYRCRSRLSSTLLSDFYFPYRVNRLTFLFICRCLFTFSQPRPWSKWINSSVTILFRDSCYIFVWI